MEYKPEFEELEPYYRAFWAGEMIDRVAVSVTAPRKAGVRFHDCSSPATIYYSAPDPILDRFEENCRNTFFGGLAAPHFSSNLGPDVFSAFLGVDLKFSLDSPGTSWVDWSRDLIADYSDLSALEIKDTNPFYCMILDYTRTAARRAAGRYIVGATDIHAGFDALSVLRGGPENASMDLVEYPDGVKAAMKKLYAAWQKYMDDYRAIVRGVQNGSDSWMSIWGPGLTYPTQNDFSCLVSNAMYREFFLDELIDEIDYLDNTIYHLDGVEALQHLDTLLEIPKLNAIQWVRGAKYDNEPIAMWFPLFRKIQAKKKAIVVYPKPAEVPEVLANLKPEGLLIQVGVDDMEQAHVVMKMCGWK